MNDIPRQKLAELVARFGPTLSEEHQRCEGFLKDLCGKYKAEINVLICAARDNVGTELLNTSSGISKEILIKRLANRLHENLGIDMQLAQWGVETWALALGIDFPINSPTNTSSPNTSPPITNKDFTLDRTTTIAIIAIIALSVIAIFSSITLAIKSQVTPENKTNGFSGSEKIISPNEARNWVGETVTVKVLIKSTHDGFDWGFLINSEEDFRNENNFTVVVDKATAGAKYNNMGGGDLNQYFKKNMVILVRGEVKTYDRKSNVRYQIKVTDLNQIIIEK